MRDIKNMLRSVISLVPAVRTSSSLTPTGVDVKDADGVVVEVTFGVVTDGTHTPSLEHSDDNLTFTAVGASELIGSFSAATSSSGGSAIQRVGYIGNKRYLRTPITITGGPSTGALMGINIIKGMMRKFP